MKEKHTFSKSYRERKEALLQAVRREEAEKVNKHAHISLRAPLKILVAVAVLSALSVSVYAAVQWIEVRMERNGDEIHFHAGLNESAETAADRDEKPLRSWSSEEGEVSIRLNIPDLPSDMSEDKTANGKYHGDDTSRSMTINGIDLRRSDLDQIIGGGADVQRIDAGGRAMYVITWDNEAAYYDRIAYIVFEEEELVLKLWVSYGITDDELLSMASTLTLEETTDPLLAIPIINEMSDGSDGEQHLDEPQVFYMDIDPIYEEDLIEIGESVRDENDWYTVTVNNIEVYDNINVLDPNCITRKDFVNRFVDENGNLIPYDRTEIIYTEEGNRVSKHFGESIFTTKKLYVVTLTMENVTISTDEAINEEMLRACVNGFDLDGYTVTDGEIKTISRNGVVNKRPEVYSGNGEGIYREYLGNNRWKVAFLLDDDIAEGDLVLHQYTGKVYVKIQ